MFTLAAQADLPSERSLVGQYETGTGPCLSDMRSTVSIGPRLTSYRKEPGAEEAQVQAGAQLFSTKQK